MNSEQPVAWLNGCYLPFSQTSLPVWDLGVVYGAAVTEMMRTYAGKPFQVEEHLNRLTASIDALDFRRASGEACNITDATWRDELKCVIHELVDRNRVLIPEDHDLGIVVFVTGGLNLTYLGAAARDEARKATVGVHTFPLPFELWSERLAKGQHLIVSDVPQIPQACIDPRIKSRNRLHWYRADQQVRKVDPSASALVLDLDGNVCETSTSNVFVVRDGRLSTPGRNILEGFTREWVMQLAGELDIPCSIEDVRPDDVATANEVFTTSTPSCMLPVTRFNGQPIGDGAVGPMFERLLSAWSDRVGVDIIRQIETGSRERVADSK